MTLKQSLVTYEAHLTEEQWRALNHYDGAVEGGPISRQIYDRTPAVQAGTEFSSTRRRLDFTLPVDTETDHWAHVCLFLIREHIDRCLAMMEKWEQKE